MLPEESIASTMSIPSVLWTVSSSTDLGPARAIKKSISDRRRKIYGTFRKRTFHVGLTDSAISVEEKRKTVTPCLFFARITKPNTRGAIKITQGSLNIIIRRNQLLVAELWTICFSFVSSTSCLAKLKLSRASAACGTCLANFTISQELRKFLRVLFWPAVRSRDASSDHKNSSVVISGARTSKRRSKYRRIISDKDE